MKIQICDNCGCLMLTHYKATILDVVSGKKDESFDLCHKCAKDLMTNLGNKRRENYEAIIHNKGWKNEN